MNTSKIVLMTGIWTKLQMTTNSGCLCLLVSVAMGANWNHAAVGYFADYIFELNGRVVNVEPFGKELLHIAQNGFALRRWNVFNADVAGERVRV